MAVYAEIDAALAEHAGACQACGQCCHFRPGGIILFATAMELAYLVGGGGMPAAAVPQACERQRACDMPTQRQPAAAGKLRHATQEVDAAWTCPYQQGGLCVARERRLLGCRTYSCDNEARGAGEEVCGGALERIRRIGAEAGLGWYGPVRLCLSSWAAAGR